MSVKSKTSLVADHDDPRLKSSKEKLTAERVSIPRVFRLTAKTVIRPPLQGMRAGRRPRTTQHDACRCHSGCT